jgi:hypothetical protein
MRRGLVSFLSALTLAGCAAIQGGETRATEQMLADAGFQLKAADTPEKLAHLQALTPRKVLLRPRHGEPYYYSVGAPECTFAAEYPACPYPCQRFADGRRA